ncbi:unnamed protein product [Danaus chrysippus]|uniref:(African queen) hypothetical protein n=1 Tax=Danaus chrysippus TaxID=151541 RepID=A0A8J2QT44_9NEOP|nr:unnamed protein product [Danaus chrysippus]
MLWRGAEWSHELIRLTVERGERWSVGIDIMMCVSVLSVVSGVRYHENEHLTGRTLELTPAAVLREVRAS